MKECILGDIFDFFFSFGSLIIAEGKFCASLPNACGEEPCTFWHWGRNFTQVREGTKLRIRKLRQSHPQNRGPIWLERPIQSEKDMLLDQALGATRNTFLSDKPGPFVTLTPSVDRLSCKDTTGCRITKQIIFSRRG